MKPEAKDPVEKDVLRLIDVLKTLARLLGYTNRDIERLTGINHATMSRYLQGKAEPRLDFLLRVVRALGLEPAEFFDFAYAERPAKLTPAARKLRRLLTGLNPDARPAAEPEEEDEEDAVPLRRRDIEQMLDDFGGITSTPQHGTAERVGIDAVKYTPAAGFTGSDSFTYLHIGCMQCSGNWCSEPTDDTATVYITVTN